jgi:hypothetical protein
MILLMLWMCEHHYINMINYHLTTNGYLGFHRYQLRVGVPLVELRDALQTNYELHALA